MSWSPGAFVEVIVQTDDAIFAHAPFELEVKQRLGIDSRFQVPQGFGTPHDAAADTLQIRGTQHEQNEAGIFAPPRVPNKKKRSLRLVGRRAEGASAAGTQETRAIRNIHGPKIR